MAHLVWAAAAVALLAGCSSSSDDAGSDASSGSVAASAAAPAPDAGGDAGGAGDAGSAAESAADTGSGSRAAPEQQAVISTGRVALRADDVGQALFDVRKVVDGHRGQVAEDDTETDPNGDPLRSRMVLRIPTADFDAAMDELGRAATLVSSQRETADVTTQVLDTDVRVEAQRRSIERIQALFDAATSIKDVVSVEGELSRRQADLASLEAQQRYLADQTSLSTITLTVERTPADHAAPPEQDDAGFLAGLSGGWDALLTFLVASATVAGALLPWLGLALLVGVPTWSVLRRLRRRAHPAAGAAGVGTP
ncbi:DUF4349 domain-containing protein [Nocardioides anomalus]|uniref:DUF4349 domain-containing protein n=1 Tax=Nocardioides anomalus TaxID=2712223 RepID=A0A6G6W8Q9_9ACTN|nr:DUF4349 domain-containing protein [Nocardioides anomalus]QIG41602.1 DUF4349 domain-containing protein [Nocardioides anomalus]